MHNHSSRVRPWRPTAVVLPFFVLVAACSDSSELIGPEQPPHASVSAAKPLALLHSAKAGLGQHGYLEIALAEAAASDLSVSLENKNSTAVVAEPGAANRTYGGQTGTYVVPAGAVRKRLYVWGDSIGTDTLIISASGYAPDTAVVTAARGQLRFEGWPSSLEVGDSAEIRLVTLVPDGNAYGSMTFATTFPLSHSSNLVFTSEEVQITSIEARFYYSQSLYVKLVGGGTGTASISHPHYQPYAADVGPANQSPTAHAGGPYSGVETHAVQFDGSASSDVDGDAISFAWDFDGDGAADASDGMPSYAYLAPGEYTVTLTVTDSKGASNSASTLASIRAMTPCEQLDGIRTDLKAIESENSGTALADKVEDARAKTDAAAHELCVKSPADHQAGAGNIEGAIGDLQAAVTDGLLDASTGKHLMDRSARVSRQLASIAIEEAIARGAGASELNDAKTYVSEGDSFRSSNDFKNAAAKYKAALSTAEGA